MIKKATYEFKKESATCLGDDDTPQKNKYPDLIQNGYAELMGIIDPQLSNEGCFGCRTEKKDDSTGPIIYEYFWSLGICGSTPDKWYEELDSDDPIVVQLIFDTANTALSFQPISASLKQLPPYMKPKEGKIAEWSRTLQPIISTTGKVLNVAGVPIVGRVISAISDMQLNNIPASDFPWYVKTFSYLNKPGVEWHIPQEIVHFTVTGLQGA